MKTLQQLSVMLLYVIFVGVNLVAQDSTSKAGGTKQIVEDTFVAQQLDNLKRDIELTYVQEVEVTKLLRKLYNDREQSKSIKDRQQQYSIKKLSNEVYIVSLDSVLRQEQRNLLKTKTEERKFK
jgi:hypothetical protein